MQGDLLILGAGGKMGPSLAQLARRAADRAGVSKRIVAVSRFSDSAAERLLQDRGIETIRADLLDFDRLDELPDALNVIFMAGRKFGSTGAPHLTWATNAALPARVAERYRHSSIVAFSSGNVYPFVPVAGGGATEADRAGAARRICAVGIGSRAPVRVFFRAPWYARVPVTVELCDRFALRRATRHRQPGVRGAAGKRGL